MLVYGKILQTKQKYNYIVILMNRRMVSPEAGSILHYAIMLTSERSGYAEQAFLKLKDLIGKQQLLAFKL